jgi:hypothetical protein
MAHANKDRKTSKVFSSNISVNFFTNQDIRLYQNIPDWPVCIMNKSSCRKGALKLKGQTGMDQILKHFDTLKNENRTILSGWICPNSQNNAIDQLNQDKFANHFNELK